MRLNVVQYYIIRKISDFGWISKEYGTHKGCLKIPEKPVKGKYKYIIYTTIVFVRCLSFNSLSSSVLR